MAYLVSPGIGINEVDQTNIVPATSTTIGGYAGHFNWGPADEIVTVGSENELASAYGSPAQGESSRSFLTAASFLKYSNALRVSRAIGDDALNAADASQVQIKNKDHFDTLTGLSFIFSARYPGVIGNSITVAYAHIGGDTDELKADAIAEYESGWAYKNIFSSAPNQSLVAVENGIDTNDEIHVVVVDTLGLITGTKGTILEKYEGLSLGANAKDENGTSMFYKEVINNNSAYIFVNTLAGTFDEADTDITASSVFAVAGAAQTSEATLSIPFTQSVVTTVTYSGGSAVTTTVSTPTDVVVGAGYDGALGNNSKVNIRYTAAAGTAAVAAHGYIRFGTPVNGDTVTVFGETFTKADASSATDFVTITDLTGLLNAIVGGTFTATEAGNYILIVSDTAEAPADIDVVSMGVGVNNTGTLEVSGPTLIGGRDAASADFLAVTVDVLDALTGYVTYDVTVAVTDDGIVNSTTVTLADIINEIDYQLAVLDNADIVPVTFSLLSTDPTASMILDIESILPYSETQVLLSIFPFTGGEAINYVAGSLLNTYDLTGGLNGAIIAGNLVDALDLFNEKELVDINFLFAEMFDVGQETVDIKTIAVANNRKDILSFISAPISVARLTSNALKKAAVEAKFDAIGSSSFIAFDQTPVYTYNKYADKYVWIPAAGHVAGLCANADFVADPWFSPAGYNRGQLKGVAKIAYNPTQSERDDLYKKRINSIVNFPGEGPILFGDKTGQTKPSAFSFINVRRLFNVLERAISTASKYQLFELNDEFTRASFKNTIEPFLRDVKGRRGITDFRVQCDEFNNTGDIIDAGQFVGDIFVKPAYSINFIQLNFIASRTGVDFKEIVGS